MKRVNKKIASLLLGLICIFTASCSPGNKKEEQDKLRVVTTIFPLYDFARTVAGDRAEVDILVPIGSEVHSYEPSVNDVIKMKESDLFINVGSDADPWTEKITDNEGINALSAFDCVSHLCEENHEGHHHDKEEHHGVMYDEHIWTSLDNACDITMSIAEKMGEMDKGNADYYKENAENFVKEATNIKKGFEETVKNGNGKTVVFADRFPFRYLADEFSIKYFAAFPGCSSESEPSVQTVSELIDKVKKEKIKVVFYTETSNQELADLVCEETGAEKMMMHSIHTLTKDEDPEKTTYLSLMRNNIDALKKALTD